MISALALVLIALATKTNRFRMGAEKMILPSIEGSWLFEGDLPGSYLLVTDNDDSNQLLHTADAQILRLMPDELTERSALGKIKRLPVPVLIVGNNRREVITSWIILTQMGIEDLFIEPVEDEDSLKYEFRPDSLFAGTGIQ